MTTATVPMMAASVATATTAALGVVVSALSGMMLTWRCHGCRRIVAKLQYDGRTVIEIRHGCNAWNRLPDDAHYLRAECGPTR